MVKYETVIFNDGFDELTSNNNIYKYTILFTIA